MLTRKRKSKSTPTPPVATGALAATPPVPPVVATPSALPVTPVIATPIVAATPVAANVSTSPVVDAASVPVSVPSTIPAPALATPSQTAPAATPASTSPAVPPTKKVSKSADKDKQCIYRAYVINLIHSRGIIGLYEYLSSVLLVPKRIKQPPPSVALTEGYLAMVYDRPETFDVVTMRIVSSNPSTLWLLLADPANEKLDPFPVDLRNITSLVPRPTTYATQKSDAFFASEKKVHDAYVNKLNEDKAKRAKVHNIPPPAKPKASSPTSSEHLPAAISSSLSTVMDRAFEHVERIIRDQHQFFDQLEARQRDNFNTLLINQQSFFKDLLHVMRP